MALPNSPIVAQSRSSQQVPVRQKCLTSVGRAYRSESLPVDLVNSRLGTESLLAQQARLLHQLGSLLRSEVGRLLSLTLLRGALPPGLVWTVA